MNKEPQVRFPLWVPWREREQIKNAHLPGVYLLAHWTGDPPREVDTLAREIVYIGETTEGSLLGRWQQFHRAAFVGKPGHSGGLRYRDNFGDAGEELYMAAFVPEGLSREMRAIFIRHVEAKLVWEWACKWDGAPLCNVKG